MIDKKGNVKIYNNQFINRTNGNMNRYERSRSFKEKYILNNTE